MKRVILSLTLALLMLGLVVPPISHATDSATPAASSRSSVADESTPAQSTGTFQPQMDNNSLGSVLDDFMEAASTLADFIGIDVEPPSMSGTPPGDPTISDRRPGGEEDPWEEQK